MPLLKGTAQVADTWTTVSDIADLPDGASAIVTLDVWRNHRDSLIQRNAPLGVRLKSDQPPGSIAGDIERFDVIALEFPKFTDGRAYSSATLLRERYGFKGELRAVGNVLRDQAMFMWRCGFDAFEVADQDEADAWESALKRYSVTFQLAPVTEGAPPAPWRPHARQRAS